MNMNWINAKLKKPEGDIFWALTEGRNEEGQRDWVIIKIDHSCEGDYRCLDGTSKFYLPDSYNGQSWYNTIFAWLPLNAIKINDKDFE